MTEEIRRLEEELNDILPDHHTGGEQRRNSLTRQDLLAIASIARKMAAAPCSIGFSEENAKVIKAISESGLTVEEVWKGRRLIKMVDRGLSIIGLLFLTAIFGTLWLIFQKGFWAWLKAGRDVVK